MRGTGDTPVIPHLYEEHGIAFAERLSGMFAVALWDRARERLVLARDRIGKKPLLWTRLADGSLAFASELKALLRVPGVSTEVDPTAIDAYLALQYVPGGTGLDAIESCPGHVLVAERGAVRVERYAHFERTATRERRRLARARARAGGRRRAAAPDLGRPARRSALRWHRLEHRRQPHGAGFRAAGADVHRLLRRRPLRRAPVRACRRRALRRRSTRSCSSTRTSPTRCLGSQPPSTSHGDDAALPLFLVCEAARRHVTVALTGDGGDESFAGYERYAAHELAQRIAVPGAGLAARALRPLGKERRSTATRAARLLEAAAARPGERYGGLMEVFSAELRTELFEPSFVPRPVPTWQLLGPPPRPGIAGLQLLDIRTYLPGDLLVKADIASMAHSLELRSPLLDWEVLELGVSLPDSLKIKGRSGKLALRRAFADELPAEVAARGKTGFGTPVRDWFRGPLRTIAEDVLLGERTRQRGQLRVRRVERLLRDHVAGRADHGHRLWCLLMLELWQRTHLDQRAAVAATAIPATG